MYLGIIEYHFLRIPRYVDQKNKQVLLSNLVIE